MTSAERVRSVLDGDRPDRPPVSFWHHFPPDRVSGLAAVRAHLDHMRDYELDFLKVMNDNGYPHAGPVREVRDLAELRELRGDEPEFARQLELIAGLRSALGSEVPMVTTIFNSWAVLRHLVRAPTEHRPPDLSGAVDVPGQAIGEMLFRDHEAVSGALRRIGLSLSRFAERCIGAGADGIFLSVRDDWVERSGADAAGLYSRAVRPTDLEILAGASGGRFNVLHVCGRAVRFRAFAEYPVHAVNWADRSAGPSIAEVKDWLKPAICGGVDNLAALPNGTPEDCEREVADALRQAENRPMIIAPGCTYDPHTVPPANLRAVARAAQQFRYA